MSTTGNAELDQDIWWSVLEECQGQKGGEPHQTTFSNHTYRYAPTLCDRCARLIETLKDVVLKHTSTEDQKTDEAEDSEPQPERHEDIP